MILPTHSMEKPVKRNSTGKEEKKINSHIDLSSLMQALNHLVRDSGVVHGAIEKLLSYLATS